MPGTTPTALYDLGTFTASNAAQEQYLLVESVKASSKRENKRWKSIVTRANVLGRESNPTMTWSISGWVTATTGGFITQHPGTTVATLANFAATTRGFDPTVGTLTFMDPEDDYSIDDLRKLSFKVEHEPFIV